MLFPWVGLLEQIRLADVYVFYDDVQFSKGGFVNRVQLKSQKRRSWMTVPLSNHTLGQPINDVKIQSKQKWVEKHLALLKQNYEDAPFYDDALSIMESTYSKPHNVLSELARDTMLGLANYFDITSGKEFINVEELGINGKSSERVLEIVKTLGGTAYITGHGAKNYLDNEAFERSGIEVKYMDYQCKEYPQQFGDFTPYVSALDLVANCGKGGKFCICSDAVRLENLNL